MSIGLKSTVHGSIPKVLEREVAPAGNLPGPQVPCTLDHVGSTAAFSGRLTTGPAWRNRLRGWTGLDGNVV